MVLWSFFTPKRVLFKAQYLFHYASEYVQTQFLYRQVLGLYKSKVSLVYDALFRRYKAIKNMMHYSEDIKNTYRFACFFFFFFFWGPAKNPRSVACSWSLYIFGTMHHVLDELWTCIDPGPVYTKTDFGLILMHSGRNTVLKQHAFWREKTAIIPLVSRAFAQFFKSRGLFVTGCVTVFAANYSELVSWKVCEDALHWDLNWALNIG